ncbi:MAG: RICIN domain-containing protein [Coriobacteriia bacterium]|nr:RICIN domain-containing protein [Coriobacteriia bacterium]
MRKPHLRSLLLSIAVICLLAAQFPYAYADTADDGPALDYGDQAKYRSDQIIVTYESDVELEGLLPLVEDINQIAEDPDGNEIAVAQITDQADVLDVIAAALDEPGVIAAQPDYIYQALEGTNDPLLGINTSWWWLDAVDAYSAWDVIQTDRQLTVALFDTGINIYHEDLAANIDLDHAWDAVNKRPLLTSIAQDGPNACGELSASGHGTHVAGILSSVANNGIGGAGVSYNAILLPIRVFSIEGGSLVSSTATLISAYDYLIDLQGLGELMGLRVVNMSLGEYSSGNYDQLLHNKIIQAESCGLMTVAAGGNLGVSNPLYPSDWPEVFSVVPIDINNQKPINYDLNANKDICAPGINIYSTSYSLSSPSNSYYQPKNGSSMAAPIVSGIACLVWSVNPGLSVNAVKQILLDTADKYGAEDPLLFGFSRVNAKSAVAAADSSIVPPPPPVATLEGFYNISSGVGNSLVLDVAGASLDNGASIITFTKNHTVAQVFQLVYDSSDDCYVIINPRSQKAIDVPGANAYKGAQLWQHMQNGTDAQKWRIIENDDGSYMIVTKLDPGLCIDVPGASREPSSHMQLHPINHTPAQKFSFGKDLAHTVPEGVYSIALAKAPGQMVDVQWGSLSDGANIQLWGSNHTVAQQFHISFDPVTGMYQMINVGSDKAVDVEGDGLVRCTNVWQHRQNNTLAQRWYFEPVGNSYRIYAAHSGLALDAEGAGVVNGTNIWIFTPNQTPAQDWLLVQVP